MDFKEFQMSTTRTIKPVPKLSEREVRVLNWTTGLANEVGELAGLIKHEIFHKEPADKMELAKELGDVMWYLAALCNTLGIPMEVCAQLNMAKLMHRHGGEYNADGSKNRHKREQAFEETEVYLLLKEMIKC